MRIYIYIYIYIHIYTYNIHVYAARTSGLIDLARKENGKTCPIEDDPQRHRCDAALILFGPEKAQGVSALVVKHGMNSVPFLGIELVGYVQINCFVNPPCSCYLLPSMRGPG